ncbi:P-loop containing nucleoside triphosphate hydrolase protein [Thozetella sp. PMI_491]|nr:P-loop containing nucleoside triphosphate hydrolase protein [Thozetella sp. PMI_491]
MQLSDPTVFMSVDCTTLIIRSRSIIRTLREVVSYYPQVNLDGYKVELQEPYTLVAHHLEELEKYRATEETAKNIGLLLDFLGDFGLKQQINDERARHAGTPAMCTFRMLWLLFKPGCTVYVQERGKTEARVVQSLHVDGSILSDLDKTPEPLILQLWSLDFDGRYVGRRLTSVVIPTFDGEREITSLEAFPCEYLDLNDGGKTKAALEESGRNWYMWLRGGLTLYKGEFVDGNGSFFDGRVVVDCAAYWDRPTMKRSMRRLRPRVGRLRDVDPGAVKRAPRQRRVNASDTSSSSSSSEEEVDADAAQTRDQQALACRCRILSRRLVRKNLLYIDISSALVISMGWPCSLGSGRNAMAIENLVMPEDRKTMIKALVEKSGQPGTGGSSTQWRADWIEHKGEGQIFLLHGSPGVGKTFFTERPLLSLTCGDIGTNETEAEKKLSGWFDLAERWGAVMLLDEADVFLEKRQLTDLNRNSLVTGQPAGVPSDSNTVFLRAVEYYRGILFLTTNRVGHFDDAFISRIHVIIAYDNLGEKERRQIWKQFFQKLADERKDIYIDSRAKRYVLEDPVMRSMNWNGREIRNAFQIAVTLAEYRYRTIKDKQEEDMITLDQGDFEQVCEMSIQFKKYLTDVHGGDENSIDAWRGGEERDPRVNLHECILGSCRCGYARCTSKATNIELRQQQEKSAQRPKADLSLSLSRRDQILGALAKFATPPVATREIEESCPPGPETEGAGGEAACRML